MENAEFRALLFMNKYLDLAQTCALQHEYDQGVDYRLCAVLVKGGKVISIGYNRSTTGSQVEYFTDMARGCGRDYSLSTHAEMDCVFRLKGKVNLKRAKIYVVRVLRNGEFAMSKPCIICQHVLYNYGIKRAFYTIDNDNFGVLKVHNPASEGS